ncbi:uncharacterized protein LOC103719052 [Phoenix dactylifera]|uniref:Uncharacterized protein LOC103719052 n=1 Tax=Phoenix dactylifera TaxID=42345 RepID=A0A8B8JAV4_PHODC|nr:uncharacterized protein LOC103719052 [Phoenix dactylifera]XP_038973290.1 uncharacterized protein LOC103719052 [Phoenix dactylifera]XP_038973291.1 uncharacterized protein LOC103719052 [Phoenix dactylifera]XP_038973292.1 uncharacterized protein LOC103719052 [Phoenix dactylifera]
MRTRCRYPYYEDRRYPYNVDRRRSYYDDRCHPYNDDQQLEEDWWVKLRYQLHQNAILLEKLDRSEVRQRQQGILPPKRSEIFANRVIFPKQGTTKSSKKIMSLMPQRRGKPDCSKCGGRGHLADFCPNKDQQIFEEDLDAENSAAPSEDVPATAIPSPSPKVLPRPAKVDDEEDNEEEEISEVILSISEPILIEFLDVTLEELPEEDSSQDSAEINLEFGTTHASIVMKDGSEILKEVSSDFEVGDLILTWHQEEQTSEKEATMFASVGSKILEADAEGAASSEGSSDELPFQTEASMEVLHKTEIMLALDLQKTDSKISAEHAICLAPTAQWAPPSTVDQCLPCISLARTSQACAPTSECAAVSRVIHPSNQRPCSRPISLGLEIFNSAPPRRSRVLSQQGGIDAGARAQIMMDVRRVWILTWECLKTHWVRNF